MSQNSRSKKTSQNSAMIRKIRLGFLAGFLVIGGGIALVARALPPTLANGKGQTGSVIFSSPHSYSQPVAETKTVKLNEPVPDFSVTDIDGEPLHLSNWKGNLGLLFFADLSCPCVQAYSGRMQALQQEYSAQGLQIAYVFSDAKDDLKGIRTLAENEKYTWRSIRDADQKLMNMFNVQCTTEAFLIDGEGILRYHGRVDDSTFEPGKAKSQDLENALVSVLKNEPVKIAETQAYACTIPRLKKKTNS